MCYRFAQVIGVTSDPRITFPYLLKIRASTLGLCPAPLVPGRRPHHSVEGPINLGARRSICTHQRRCRHQTLVAPAANVDAHLSRFRPLALCRRRLSAREAGVSWPASANLHKTFTKAPGTDRPLRAWFRHHDQKRTNRILLRSHGPFRSTAYLRKSTATLLGATTIIRR